MKIIKYWRIGLEVSVRDSSGNPTPLRFSNHWRGLKWIARLLFACAPRIAKKEYRQKIKTYQVSARCALLSRVGRHLYRAG
jgi:hypothetical protein